MLRQIRRFVNISVRTLLVVCVLAFVSLRLSGVKTWIGERAGAALAERLGTSVRVGRVDIGMLNRVIVDDVTIYDLYGKRMLRAGRLSVKLLFSDLIQGKITIASAQVFGLKADLYKLKGGEQANFLFLADAFKTDEDSTRKPINLRINSLIIRRSEIKYNDWNAPREPDVVSPKHINVRDISAHVIVNTLSPDSADVNIRRLSMRDECGLDIRRMSLRLVAGLSGAELSDFSLVLPCSELHINSAASYNLVSGDTTRIENLKYSGTITDSSILPPELHVIKGLERLSDVPINVAADFSGTDNSLTVSRLELKQGADFALVTSADGFRDNSGMPHWTIALERLETSCEGIRNILQSAGKNVSLPAFAGSLERIALSGEASGADKDLSLSAQLATNIGDINLQIDKNGAALHGTAEADSVSIAALTGNNDFGKCTLALDVDADINGRKITTGNAQADIRGFDFKGHTYQNMTFNAGYNRDKDLNIAFTASDEFGSADVAIVVNEFTESYLTRTNLCSPDIHIPHTTYNISVRDIRPAAMGLIKSEENEAYSADISGTFACNGFDNSNGTLRVNNLMKTTADTTYCLKEFLLDIASVPEGDKKIICRSDCGDIRLTGNFRYAALPNSFTAVLAAQLPALDIKTTETGTHNKFDIYATITDTDPLCNFLNIPLRTDEPVHLIAKADDANRTISINADAKKFRYGEKEYSDVWLVANAPSDTLRVRANAKSTDDDGNTLRVNISSRAYDNRLASSLLFDSNARNHITGNLNTRVDLSEKTPEGMPVVRADVLPSDVMVADTLWSINPARITYRENYLAIDNLDISRGDRYIRINGLAQKGGSDNIVVGLNDVNVGYILDFVDFHAVDFDGETSGEVKVESLFDSPAVYGRFDVAGFHFEGGAMGTAHINMDYSFDVGAINIDAIVSEEAWRETDVKGYVNLKDKEINLNVKAIGSSLNFINKYCDGFAEISNANGWGEVNVTGPLGGIELLGSATATADMRLLSTDVTYHLRRQQVNFNIDDIEFASDTLTDRYGHAGILTGHLPHSHLSDISYHLKVDAKNLLALDLKDFGEDSYYGTVYATGSCSVDEVADGTLINVDITPEDKSFIMYNATAPDRVTDSFIRWRDRSGRAETDKNAVAADVTDEDRDMLPDVRINFAVNCDSRSELRILMDERMGDIITLNGSGLIRASFYNKGGFELFGNYVIERGTYRMTIQDVIKRDFTFKQGGSISFGGDALSSRVNLQALYTLNSVPLSDINIGKSYANNNVRVDCIMNITGTTDNPQIDFSLDLPTIGSDAKQMIMSMFNDTEEMNQQVIYLIAVGRFLNQNNNNANESARYSQTSLAMQSILSGTVSGQINSLLENVIGSRQWDFGANISTGEEGFNDAEYEGLVSGRMFNNRLIFNGQFGYRDNSNATSSFIGDFDLRYLLVPTGSLAVRIYTETNNRYFTKNAMNTQGVSLIVKKDFAGWRDFFRRTRGKQSFETKQ